MKNPWRVLRGREQLHVVFWGYCVVGTAIVIALPTVDRPHFLMGMPLWFFVALALMQAAYLLWAHISLWTCAFNTSRRAWGYAARAYICVIVLGGGAWLLTPRVQPDMEGSQIIGNAQQAIPAERPKTGAG